MECDKGQSLCHIESLLGPVNGTNNSRTRCIMPVTINKEADMNNQASDGITDAGKDLVLSCIKSQELRDHMR